MPPHPHRPGPALLAECSRRGPVFRRASAFATFGVAGVATALGFWPVLPFAGAEMLLLAWALHSNMQRRFERETIDISDTEVVIDLRAGKPCSRRVPAPLGTG